MAFTSSPYFQALAAACSHRQPGTFYTQETDHIRAKSSFDLIVNIKIV
jgi:hypothetical protein